MSHSPLVLIESFVRFSERPVLDRLKELEVPGTGEESRLEVPSLAEGEQFRFHFDMTRCIGCRCCEVACNEQNNNPSHVKWRRVGEVEGGSYPHVHRFHVSMSCNHCLEPSCLEGCPVDAYAKLANGVVTHDAEACIGCQYCTWSCPYGVPQYHPERRVVTKCNLCVDRLAEGQLPACVEACPTRAIEIEKVNITQWRAAIAGGNAPGVPPADLTYSTTRLTLPEDLPEDMGRSEPWRLEPEAPHWPLVFLLVLSQWSVGLFAAALACAVWYVPFGAGCRPLSSHAAVLSLAAFLIGQVSLSISVLHLGRPLHALRAMRAWRRSWLSREALAFLVFSILGFLSAAAGAFELKAVSEGAVSGPWRILGLPLLALTFAAGAYGVRSSAGIYRIAARPAWDTWRTPAQFLLTVVSLGGTGAVLGLVTLEVLDVSGVWTRPLVDSGVVLWSFAMVSAVSFFAQAFVPWTLVAEGLRTEDPSLLSTVSLLTRRFSRVQWLRTLLLVASALLLLAAATQWGRFAAIALVAASLACGLSGEILDRYLFFVTVVPRNMPGHFFSRNSPTRH